VQKKINRMKLNVSRTLSLLIILSTFASCAQVNKLTNKLNLKKRPKKVEKIFTMKWAKNLDPIHLTGNLPLGHGTPLINDDTLYFADKLGFMKAYDLNNGRVRWQKNENKSLSGKSGIYKGHLYYSSFNGRLYCRNIRTGELSFAVDLKSPIESEPVFYAGRLFYHLRDHQVVAIDASSGKLLWSYKRSIPYSTTLQRVSVPLIFDNKVFIGFADGYISAISLDSGSIVWEKKITQKSKFVDVDVRPILFKGHLVVGSANGDLKFLNPKNGAQSNSVSLTISTTPIVDGDRLLIGTTDGEVAIIGQAGNILARKKISTKGVSSLLKWKNGLVASAYDGYLTFIERKTFETKERFHLGTDQSTIFGSLVISRGYLAAYSSRNRLYVFK
jgi:outer membrane protein assembly factor BamB